MHGTWSVCMKYTRVHCSKLHKPYLTALQEDELHEEWWRGKCDRISNESGKE